MDFITILPIVGIIIGWFLKELSDYIRQRNADRKEIGTALTGMLQLEAELRRLETFLKYYKDRTDSWKKYESFRVRTARRYLKRTDPIESIQAATKVLASSNPLDAVLLRESSMLLESFHKLSLKEITDNEEFYIKSLSTFEVIFDVSFDILKKLILKLAWLHSSITYIKIRLLWRRYKSKLSRDIHQFTEQQLDEVFNFKKSKPDAEN